MRQQRSPSLRCSADSIGRSRISLTNATVLQYAAATLCRICKADTGLQRKTAATSADTAVRAGYGIQ